MSAEEIEQCKQCGSPLFYEDCEICTAHGWWHEYDPTCPICHGNGYIPHCSSTAEWYNATPPPDVEPHPEHITIQGVLDLEGAA